MSSTAKNMVSVMGRILNSRRFLPICFLLAFFVRLGWIYLMPVQPISDFSWYHLRGVDLAKGLGYVEAGEPTAYWPVGYPAFLGMLYSVFGQSVSVAKLANILLYMGVIFLCYRLTRSLFRSEIVGRISVLLIAFYPNHIAYSSLLSCEILYLFLLLLATFFLVRRNRETFDLAISGMVFGLACLVKPQTLPLAGVILVSYYGYSRKISPGKMLRNLLMVYGVIVLVISPWIARNYLVFGQFVYISNNGGVTLMIGNNPYANGTYIPFEGEISSLLGEQWIEDECRRDVLARNYAFNYMISHPLRTVALWPRKLMYMYREDVEGVNWNEESLGPDEANDEFFWYYTGLAQNYYLVVMIFFLISIVALFRWKGTIFPSLPLVGLSIISYMTMVYMFTIGISRFHFPLVPWILGYVSALFYVMGKWISDGFSPS